ncbi:DUF1127 domain-containing protein [Oricola sp.]|uniref:DUF1127 domain-containing protein n=1 Tax=Oricola sp. TaxID=1979950 RepID=UPI003BAD3C0F
MTTTDETNTRPYPDIASRHAVVFRSMRLLRERWATRQRERRVRKEMRELLHMNDAMLRDIGVLRGDISYVSGLPLDRSAFHELHRVSGNPRFTRLDNRDAA